MSKFPWGRIINTFVYDFDGTEVTRGKVRAAQEQAAAQRATAAAIWATGRR